MRLSGTASTGVWQFRVSGGSQRVLPDVLGRGGRRKSRENIVRAQRTPSDFVTFGGQWKVQAFGNHSLLVGAEGKRIESTLNETRLIVRDGQPGGLLATFTRPARR